MVYSDKNLIGLKGLRFFHLYMSLSGKGKNLRPSGISSASESLYKVNFLSWDVYIKIIKNAVSHLAGAQFTSASFKSHAHFQEGVIICKK